ncbi:MAG: hypothetical protein ABH858_02595 [Candidatus Omnitrophota bacterium]
MANPMQNEEQIYQRIRMEGRTVPKDVWDLINHHVRNDLMVVSMAIGTLASLPKWILNAASFLIRFLYKTSRMPGEPPDDILTICNSVLNRVKIVDTFLRKLKAITEE